uniref:C4-dicarboxylate-binding protein DctP n=1 Tax=Candidatus Kentrum sp. TUN TaxID=2126343 RepID=A0A450ZIY7_9GAMM|nr:MAG: C4-dicarboxylate-binding protein DctP [Candidatus Kentron sp. TUN]VFK53775.1 MAG: C4-dicarboxylate-binding protein DctP [Candidatus Kentron sp. TUN]VFK56517.1 MAG: C4-dicarboxylate-binding protein DctP [Candidatus Kentron sp. TUN]
MRTIIATLLATFLAFFVSTTYGTPIVIKFAHLGYDDSPKGKMAHRFEELVERKFPDKVKIEVYPDSQLAYGNQIVDKIITGEIEMGAPPLSKFKKYSAKYGIFDMPFLFDGIGAVDKFKKTKEGKSLLKAMEHRGIIGLGYMHYGMKQFSANRPLFSPSDAKGLKFRIMDSAILVAQFKALNAIPVKKSLKYVHDALERGEIDGQESTWSNMYSRKIHEVQKYITESNHGYVGYMIITNMKFWNSIDPTIRKELRKALNKAIAFGNQEAVMNEVLDRNKIVKAHRAKIMTLEASDKEEWIKYMEPVWHEFDDLIGKDLIDAAHKSN